MLNVIQKAAYELIQADARFLYTLTDIQRNEKNINSNYIMMSQPYMSVYRWSRTMVPKAWIRCAPVY